MPIRRWRGACERCCGNGTFSYNREYATDVCFECDGSGIGKFFEAVDANEPSAWQAFGLNMLQVDEVLAWAEGRTKEARDNLWRLAEFDSKRFRVALESIRTGRGDDVDSALRVWARDEFPSLEKQRGY